MDRRFQWIHNWVREVACSVEKMWCRSEGGGGSGNANLNDLNNDGVKGFPHAGRERFRRKLGWIKDKWFFNSFCRRCTFICTLCIFRNRLIPVFLYFCQLTYNEFNALAAVCIRLTHLYKVHQFVSKGFIVCKQWKKQPTINQTNVHSDMEIQ